MPSGERIDMFKKLALLPGTLQWELLRDLESVRGDLLDLQRQLITASEEHQSAPIEPFKSYSEVGDHFEDLEQGRQLIAEGKMGCLLLAGGQGSRLGFEGPKGCYPISPICRKSLFQLCAEKVAAAGAQVGRALPLAIMVSPQNEGEIRAFFVKNHFFGLHPSQVDFFSQTELPLLDSDGNLFLETPSHLAMGPDGNGRCLQHFVRLGLWSRWYEQGVRYLNLILIDNPLADPFDAELLGFHYRQDVEVTVKCVERFSPHEKVGVLVHKNGRPAIVEYSEMLESEKSALGNDGRLKHRCANISLFCFSMQFIKDIPYDRDPLPLHKAWKAVRYLNERGESCKAAEPNAWKFEFFVFDLLKYTDRIAALLYPRWRCFAPLKNTTGVDSPETVQKALQAYDRYLLETISGIAAPSFAFELEAQFHYPLAELRAKWWKRPVKSPGYIDN